MAGYLSGYRSGYGPIVTVLIRGDGAATVTARTSGQSSFANRSSSAASVTGRTRGEVRNS